MFLRLLVPALLLMSACTPPPVAPLPGPWRFSGTVSRSNGSQVGTPIGGAELPREVCGRHQRSPGERGDIERAHVLAVHQVAGTAQMREVGELLRRHDASVGAY